MIELDKRLSQVCAVINNCYETLFPNLPKYPKFSFTRVMITMWKNFVYSKLEDSLLEQFKHTFENVRNKKFAEIFEKATEEKKGAIDVENVDVEMNTEFPKEQLLSRYCLF